MRTSAPDIVGTFCAVATPVDRVTMVAVSSSGSRRMEPPWPLDLAG